MKRIGGSLILGLLSGAALALAPMADGSAWGGQPSADAAVAMDRASALLRAHDFEGAIGALRAVLLADPSNRAANEMLAFALESKGDLEGERRVRSKLASRFPRDARIQADYGRVLERSGRVAEALRAYRRARDLATGAAVAQLDAAIDRTRGQTALEIGTPLSVISDPDADASTLEAGAAVPVGAGNHLALLAARSAAAGRKTPYETEAAAIALALVRPRGAGPSWSLGPSLHVISPKGGAARDLAVGGVATCRTSLGPAFEADLRADFESPWDDAAVTVLHGGRTSAVEGHLYAHALSRRLLFQVGGRRRRISILATDRRSPRPDAWQTLWIGGADVVAWRSAAAIRGEMLDEALIAPMSLHSAVTLAYRHYGVWTQTTPEFATLVDLAPRGSVDEASVATTLASVGGRLGLELRAGLAHDSARRAREWRAGGSFIWSPFTAARLALGYEEANELATGLAGQRRTGRLSFHVDL
jgi:tetratricopeptide (TPR) repeat protein